MFLCITKKDKDILLSVVYEPEPKFVDFKLKIKFVQNMLCVYIDFQ